MFTLLSLRGGHTQHTPIGGQTTRRPHCQSYWHTFHSRGSFSIKILKTQRVWRLHSRCLALCLPSSNLQKNDEWGVRAVWGLALPTQPRGSTLPSLTLSEKVPAEFKDLKTFIYLVRFRTESFRATLRRLRTSEPPLK